MALETKLLSSHSSGTHSVPCPKCRYAFPRLENVAIDFFENGSVKCGHCGDNVDLWAAALDWMSVVSGSFLALTSFGAETTTFKFELRAGEYKEILLTEHGVPEDALLLHVGFTPQGGDCMPNIVHGNAVPARPLAKRLLVFGKAITPPMAPGPISTVVGWVRPSPDSASWVYLAEAFESFAARTYWHMLVPAFVSYEISLMALVRKFLETTASKERLRAFLRDLKSSHALNVLLPWICSAAKVKSLPNTIRGELNRLRDARNDFVHEGLERTSVTEEMANRFLCASIFGLEHLRYTRKKLSAPLTRDEQPSVPKKATGTHFYRYHTREHLDWLKQIVLENRLYVPLVSQLNDPLDCKPKINIMSEDAMVLFLRNEYIRTRPVVALDLLQQHDAQMREKIKLLGLEWFLQQMADIMYRQMDGFRVYSMSKRFDNFSMWAKYAAGHTGYCLEFANEGPLFGEHTLEVTYGEYPPFDLNDAKQRNAIFLTYKRRDWCNEEEVRLIRARGSSEFVGIEPRWLTRIILGKDMPEEDRAQILEWANQRESKLAVVQASFDALRHELRLTSLN